LRATLQVLQEFSVHHWSQRFDHRQNQAMTLRRRQRQLATNMLHQVRTVQPQASADVGVKELRS